LKAPESYQLIPAQHVVAYHCGGKNDAGNAQTIGEAAAQPSMKSVPVKTTDQQDLQAIRRVRKTCLDSPARYQANIREV